MGKIIKNGRVYAGGVTVDSTLDTTSENPIQNKVVATAINGLNSELSSFSYKAGDTISFTDNSYNILTGLNTSEYRLQFFIPLDKPVGASNVAISLDAAYVRSPEGLGTLDLTKLTSASVTKCIGGIRVEALFSVAQFHAIQQMFAVTFNGTVVFH